MDIRDALKILTPFVDAKKADLGYHTLSIEHGRACATNGIDGCLVDGCFGSLSACVPFADLKRAVNSAPAGMVKLTPLKKTVKVTTPTATFRFRQLTPVLKIPTPPPADQWFPVDEAEIGILRSMAAIAKGGDPEGVRLAPTWFGSCRQTMAIVARRSTFACLSEPVTISAKTAAALHGAQHIAYDGARVWFRADDAPVVQWTTPYAAVYPDAIGETIVPGALTDADRVRFPMDVGVLRDVVGDAKLLSDAATEPARLAVEDSRLTVEVDAATSGFKATIAVDATAADFGCEHPATPTTAPAGVTISQADVLLSAFAPIVADCGDVTMTMCPATGPDELGDSAITQQVKPFVFNAAALDVVAVLMPVLMR